VRIKLQILLRAECRTPQGIGDAKRALSSLGIASTGHGDATISAEIDAEDFEKLFGSAATAPRSWNENLAVPSALRSHVQSISVAPPHLYMQ
jgi:hypothetical protein